MGQNTSHCLTRRILALVFFGLGPISIAHQWVRVESDGDGVHLHGYYNHPEMVTADFVQVKFSAIKVDHPDREADFARVSFT